MLKREVLTLSLGHNLDRSAARWRKMKPKPAVALCKSGQPQTRPAPVVRREVIEDHGAKERVPALARAPQPP
jgi:hypothetical protein